MIPSLVRTTVLHGFCVSTCLARTLRARPGCPPAGPFLCVVHASNLSSAAGSPSRTQRGSYRVGPYTQWLQKPARVRHPSPTPVVQGLGGRNWAAGRIPGVRAGVSDPRAQVFSASLGRKLLRR